MARVVSEGEAPALPRHLQDWPRSWPRSGTISSGRSRAHAMHSMGTVSAPGKKTRIGRGDMRPEEERYPLDVGRSRRCSAERLSRKAEVPLVRVGGTGETLEARHLASWAMALVNLRHPGVIRPAPERAHAEDRRLVRRPGSQFAALQRRWINSGRHSLLPRAPRRGTRKRHGKGRCRSSVEDRHAARSQEEH